jgi:hypothetical protein
MNYLKVYCNLIRKAENRTPPEGYTEKHHTFPKSIFGKNNRIVILTSREHYIAHALLEKIYIKRYGIKDERTIKMTYAFWCMNNQNTLNEYFNSYFYEFCKIRYIESVSGENHPWYGRKHTLETRIKMSKSQTGEKHAMYGRTHTEEAKQKMSNSHIGIPSPKGMLGKNHSEEAKQKIRQSQTGEKNNMYGRTHSEETKQKMREDERHKLGGAKAAKITNSQKWMCTETGYVSTPGGLSSYQKSKGIDISKRVKIE